MIQPIVGIKLKNKSFVSLLNAEGKNAKQVFVYGDDFDEGKIPVFLCKMQTEKKIQKIFKVGQIEIPESYLKQIKTNADDVDSNKNVIRITTTLSEEGMLSINVAFGLNKSFRPLKLYETNVISEIETQDYHDLQSSLLDYGDFVKCITSDAELLPEEDISNEDVLKETYSKVTKEKKNKRERTSDEYYDLAEKAEESRTSVAGKMVVSVMLVLFVVAAGIVSLFAFNFKNNSVAKEKDFTKEVNERVVYSVNSEIEGLKSKADVMLKMNADDIVNTFMNSNTDIVAFVSDDLEVYNYNYLNASGISESKINDVIKTNKASANRAKYGKTVVKNVSHILGQRTAIIFIPLKDKKYCSIIFTVDQLDNICLGNSEYVSYIVDKKGFIISGIDPQLVATNQNLCDDPVVREYLNAEGDKENLSVTVKDETYGYITETDNGEFAVITTYAITNSSNMTMLVSKEILCLTVAVVVLAMIIIWALGKRISICAKALTEATKKVSRGDFNLNLKTSSHDEFGTLTRSFDSMAKSLILRDAAKRALGRFADPSLEEKVQNGELKLDGENKFSTIMFIGIRNFNNLSKRFRPEELLEFLNNYYGVIRKVVSENGGYIDKVMGDTVMTTWGTPVSSGTPKQDAINAVNAALKLKNEIIDFNAQLDIAGKPSVTIGCGINTGSVVAGEIGSDEWSSYTCIGPIVSVAAAAEKLNKKYESRILITESTYNLVNEFVKVEEKHALQNSNSEECVRLFAVTGVKGGEEDEE